LIPKPFFPRHDLEHSFPKVLHEVRKIGIGTLPHPFLYGIPESGTLPSFVDIEKGGKRSPRALKRFLFRDNRLFFLENPEKPFPILVLYERFLVIHHFFEPGVNFPLLPKKFFEISKEFSLQR